MKQVYLYDAIRSPRGKARPEGGLHELTPQAVLSQLYRALTERTGLNPDVIDEVVLGCVTQQGEQAGNVAKTSALYHGWPSHVGGLTVNRFCSSSIDAINIAALKIAAGQAEVMVAGGVEMMSRIPMLADEARVFTDPAFAVQCQILMMGSGADLIASLHGVTREQADQVALLSQQRAGKALHEGYFRSVIPIEDSARGLTLGSDECVRAQTSAESLAALKPAFAELGARGVDALQLAAHPGLTAIDHIHTAGNSPAMADAASVVLLGDEALGQQLGVEPRALLRGAATASEDPLQVLTGCVAATAALLRKHDLQAADIDLFELHEAFAATSVLAGRALGIPQDKLNVNGGVIALGHPMGATGAIMAGVLLDELERRNLPLGVVAASGAAGAGSALLIERL